MTMLDLALIAIVIGSAVLGTLAMIPAVWSQSARITALRSDIADVRRANIALAWRLIDATDSAAELRSQLAGTEDAIIAARGAHLAHLSRIGKLGNAAMIRNRPEREAKRASSIREMAERLATCPPSPLTSREQIVAEARANVAQRRIGRQGTLKHAS